MATLKDHQNAMVDLLANGSAIPASAARLAHALHDVLGLLLERDSEPHSSFVGGQTATAAFSGARPKGMYVSKLAIDNLRAELANVTSQRDQYKAQYESLAQEAFDLDGQIEELKTKLEDTEEKLEAQAFDLCEHIKELKTKLEDKAVAEVAKRAKDYDDVKEAAERGREPLTSGRAASW